MWASSLVKGHFHLFLCKLFGLGHRSKIASAGETKINNLKMLYSLLVGNVDLNHSSKQSRNGTVPNPSHMPARLTGKSSMSVERRHGTNDSPSSPWLYLCKVWSGRRVMRVPVGLSPISKLNWETNLVCKCQSAQRHQNVERAASCRETQLSVEFTWLDCSRVAKQILWHPTWWIQKANSVCGYGLHILGFYSSKHNNTKLRELEEERKAYLHS